MLADFIDSVEWHAVVIIELKIQVLAQDVSAIVFGNADALWHRGICILGFVSRALHIGLETLNVDQRW
jgi:hypothetical protein